MDYDKRHKRRSGGLGSEPDDLGDRFPVDNFADSLGLPALDAQSAPLGAEVLTQTKKHAGGRPPGHSTHRLDGGKKRAADRERHRAKAAAAAAVEVRALLHHFPITALSHSFRFSLFNTGNARSASSRSCLDRTPAKPKPS